MVLRKCKKKQLETGTSSPWFGPKFSLKIVAWFSALFKPRYLLQTLVLLRPAGLFYFFLDSCDLKFQTLYFWGGWLLWTPQGFCRSSFYIALQPGPWLRIIWFRSVGVEPSTMGIHFALNVLLDTGKYKLIATFPSWYYHFKVIIFDRLPEIPTRRQTHPGIAFWCYLFRPWVAETLFLLFQPEGFLFCNVRSLPKQWMT